MQKEYIVKKVDNLVHDIIWPDIPELYIDCFPWDNGGYKPEVKVRVCYTENALHIRFDAFEKNITIKYLQYCEPVYKDSCVEFFFNPAPSVSNRYMNFEMNAVGTLLLGIGSGRGEWRLLEEVDPAVLKIKASIKKNEVDVYEGPSWSVEYSIPFSLLETYYGKLDIKPGTQMKANFYKCGDETAFEHFGCWNPIEIEKPDFHRPEFFGKLVFG